MASNYNRATGAIDAFTTGTLTGVVSGSDHGNKADAMNKVQAQVVKEAPWNLAWPEFGLSAANSAAANTTAIEAGAAALGAGGGELLVPLGDFAFTTLDFEDSRSVRLVGCGGLSGGATTGSILRSTQTGSAGAALINARSTFGFAMRDVFVISSSWAGHTIDLKHSAAAIDATYATFERCNIFGNDASATQVLLNLDKAIIASVRDCHFEGGRLNVQGRADSTSYANGVTFDNCTFMEAQFCAIQNPGETWAFYGCTWEPLSTGGPGGITFSTAGGVAYARGLTIDSGWFGDSNDTGTWLLLDGVGINVRGCMISGANAGIRVGSLLAASDGVIIEGNSFVSNVTADIVLGASVVNHRIGPNHHDGTATDKISGIGAPASVASAATLTIPLYDDLVRVTGTTNITNVALANSTMGREVTLVFAGILTFTDGGNLNINGNFATSAGDTITLKCNGTEWVEIGRSAN